nr:hypothetical protein Iba_chr04aCG17990 [Ipomoea batatas]
MKRTLSMFAYQPGPPHLSQSPTAASMVTPFVPSSESDRGRSRASAVLYIAAASLWNCCHDHRSFATDRRETIAVASNHAPSRRRRTRGEGSSPSSCTAAKASGKRGGR